MRSQHTSALYLWRAMQRDTVAEDTTQPSQAPLAIQAGRTGYYANIVTAKTFRLFTAVMLSTRFFRLT